MREGRTVRLLSCNLEVAEDITDKLLDYTLAWIWECQSSTVNVVKEKGLFVIWPCQGMYDFGLDDERPLDWLVWTEHSGKSVCVVHDLRVLYSLGVRGNFVINEVGTLIIEKWKLADGLISTYVHEVTFSETPDIIAPVTRMKGDEDALN